MPNRPYLDASVQWRINSGQLSLEEPDYRSVVDAILSAGLATEVLGLISAGKEANVYLARYNGAPLAIKSYRLYRTSHRGGGPVKQDSMGWRAAHEYEMMRQAWKGGVRVPTPARRVENRFSMRYLGTDGGPAPRLKDVVLEDPREFLERVLDVIRRLIGAGVVHGDLSAFNVLFHEDEPWVIDFSEAIRVDRARVHESLDDLIVRDAERPRRRRRADGQERVPDFLPIASVEVHHHDRPDAALLAVQAGLLRDPVEGVGELVFAPRRGPRGAGDRHRDPARDEGLAHEPRALFESRLDRRRVLDHEVRGEFAQRGGVRRIVFVPEVRREGPVLHRREVRDDVSASRRQDAGRGLRNHAGVHDHRDRRLGREAHLLPVLLDRGARRHHAVVARGRRRAHERHAGIEGRALRHVNRTPAAHTERELDVPFANLLFSLPNLFHRRIPGHKFPGAGFSGREFPLDGHPRDLHRRLVRDDQGAFPQFQRLADLSDRM